MPLTPRSRLALAGLYGGGFLGPFGGGVVVSMLPELGADLGTTAPAASVSLTAYLLPFAALLLVSGSLGERWGARRTVLGAYLVYVAASVGCALATTLPLFLGLRAVQGAANAFITPLLLATLAAITPRARLGRALGLFAALQAVGNTSAPLLGGLAAEVTWEWAFVGIAAVALALAAVGLPAVPGTGDLPPGRLRDAWQPRTVRLGTFALVAWGCFGGLSFLVALRAVDDFGLGAAARGLLLTGFGALGVVTARLVGSAVDRVGASRCVLAGALAGLPLLVGLGLTGSVVGLAVLWAVAGTANQLILVGLNALVLTGASPGGAVSVVQALRFFGQALAPAAFLPVYAVSSAAAFLLPAALLAVVAPLAVRRELAQRPP